MQSLGEGALRSEGNCVLIVFGCTQSHLLPHVAAQEKRGKCIQRGFNSSSSSAFKYAGMVMSELEVDVLDDVDSSLKFLFGSPTACPGSQPQMATELKQVG